MRALHDEVRRGKHRTTKGHRRPPPRPIHAHIDGQGASPSTLRSYRSYIAHNIEPEFGHLDVADVDVEMIDAFYAKLRARGLSPSTISQHHAILSGAFKQARKWRWVDASPVELATAPKVRNADAVAPTVEQVHRLVELAEERNPTLATLLFVAATTGARRGELCALRWSHVDLEARTMLIAQSVVEVGPGEWQVKGTKTHKTGRIALDDATVAALRAHLARLEAEATAGGVQLAPDGFVFSPALDGTMAMRPGNVTNFMARLRDDAGCPGVKLHHLRHFMATRALAAGMDVRTVAGRLRHDPTMTLRVYGHFLEEQDRKVADHMGELMPRREPPD
jgi:integrase